MFKSKKNKKNIEKQVLGAATVVGAGLAGLSVTAYADEGDDNALQEVQITESAETTSSEGAAPDPIEEVSETFEDTAETSQDTVETYNEVSDIANDVVDSCDSIDTESTPSSEAESIVESAEETLQQAEDEMNKASEELDRAEEEYQKAAEELLDIDEEQHEVREELSEAQNELEENKQDYEAKKEEADAAAEEVKKYTDIAKKNAIYGEIDKLKKELADMDKDDENYASKLETAGMLVALTEYLTDTKDLAAYRRGEIELVFSMDENGDIIVSRKYEKEVEREEEVKPAVEESYRSSNGKVLPTGETVVWTYIDESDPHKGIYAVDLSEKDIIIGKGMNFPTYFNDTTSDPTWDEWLIVEDNKKDMHWNRPETDKGAVTLSVIDQVVFQKVDVIRGSDTVTYSYDNENIVEVLESEKKYFKDNILKDIENKYGKIKVIENEDDFINPKTNRYYDNDYDAIINVRYSYLYLTSLRVMGQIDYEIRTIDKESMPETFNLEEDIYRVKTYNYVPGSDAEYKTVIDKITTEKTVATTGKGSDLAGKIDSYNETIQKLRQSSDTADEAKKLADAAYEKVVASQNKVDEINTRIIPTEKITSAHSERDVARANLEVAKKARSSAEVSIARAKTAIENARDKVNQIKAAEDLVKKAAEDKQAGKSAKDTQAKKSDTSKKQADDNDGSNTNSEVRQRGASDNNGGGSGDATNNTEAKTPKSPLAPKSPKAPTTHGTGLNPNLKGNAMFAELSGRLSQDVSGSLAGASSRTSTFKNGLISLLSRSQADAEEATEAAVTDDTMSATFEDTGNTAVNIEDEDVALASFESKERIGSSTNRKRRAAVLAATLTVAAVGIGASGAIRKRRN